jgi:hypothetical protein
MTLRNGSTGSSPAARMSAIASASEPRCRMLCSTLEQVRHPAPPLLDVVVRRCHHRAAPDTAAAPSAMRSGIGFRGLQPTRDHDRSGILMANSLLSAASRPRAPLAARMAAVHVCVAGRHLLTAPFAAAHPRFPSAGVRFQRLYASLTHDFSGMLGVQGQRLPSALVPAVPAARALHNRRVARLNVPIALCASASPRPGRSRERAERLQTPRAHYRSGLDGINSTSGTVSTRRMSLPNVIEPRRYPSTARLATATPHSRGTRIRLKGCRSRFAHDVGSGTLIQSCRHDQTCSARVRHSGETAGSRRVCARSGGF